MPKIRDSLFVGVEYENGVGGNAKVKLKKMFRSAINGINTGRYVRAVQKGRLREDTILLESKRGQDLFQFQTIHPQSAFLHCSRLEGEML